MKRIFTFGLMLTALFALTNCTEELVDQTVPSDEVTQETVTPKEEGIPFQVKASFEAETKTAGEITTDGKLKTKWVSNDKIHVFYEDKEGTLVNAGVFTVSDTDNGIFNGFIPSNINPEETYNWYFVYDATKANLTTTSNEGVVTATVTIGSSEQTQSSANNNTHIGGASNCPMWGKAENVSGSVTPRVQMSHLASLYEVTIENQTSDNEKLNISKGDIYVYDLGMSVSSTGTWMTKDNDELQALVGDFNLNLLTGDIITDVANKDYSVHLNLINPIQITTEGDTKSAKFYFVAAPRQIQVNKTIDPNWYEEIANPSNLITKDKYNSLTDKEKEKYQSTAKRQDTFTFKVNGAERNVGIQKTYNMERANVYKFTLPVRSISHPYQSDAFNVDSEGRETADNTHVVNDVITTTAAETTINVNGHEFNAFVIDNADDNVTINGFASDLLSAVPIGFYTSAWNNEPSVMTVKNIEILYPTYQTEETDQVKSGTVIKYISEATVTTYYKTIKGRGSVPMQLTIFGYDVKVDLPLSISRDMLTSVAGGIASKITFSGMPSQGHYDNMLEGNHNVLVMNEEYSYKQINSENLNSFLKTFGDGASYEGFLEILTVSIDELPNTFSVRETRNRSGAVTSQSNLTSWPPTDLEKSHPALVQTANAIYNKLSSYTMAFDIAGYDLVEVSLAGPKGIFKNQVQLIHALRDARITAELGTTTDGPKLVFWGIDAKGPDIVVQ